jgi:adenylate kinase family enzyme
MKPIVICILGSPSCGKRTQAGILSQELAIPQANMGRMLGRLSERDDEVGRSLREVIKHGASISELYFTVLLEGLLKEYSYTGVIISGFPHTAAQAKVLFKYHSEMVKLIVIDLWLSKKETYQRVQKKVAEPGHVLHIAERPEVLDEKWFMFNLNHPPLEKVLTGKENSFNEYAYKRFEVNHGIPTVQKEIYSFVREELGQAIHS